MRCLTFICMLAGINSFAQVVNNDIENRSRLDLNKPIQSSTEGADVQWKCINKVLTNKCLVYHNDQWFTFSVEKDGDYFVNIGSQKCRDSKGLQLIVIEGNPCEASTYRIIECISQIRMEDVFVAMPALKAGVQYLVNVDGFLGDQCSFNIELSDRARGLPRDPVNLDTLKVNSRLESKVVSMEWHVNEDLARALSAFRIVRQKDRSRSDIVAEMSLGRNAIGSAVKKYQFVDTLGATGVYRYEIYGIREADNLPLLLSQSKFYFYPRQIEASEEPVTKVLTVRMNFKEGEAFDLRLYNYDGDQLLWTHEGASQGEGEMFMIDPQPYTKYGLRKFQLLVLDGEKNKVDEIYFRVDHNGAVIKE